MFSFAPRSQRDNNHNGQDGSDGEGEDVIDVELTAQKFAEELARYRKVRDENWQGWVAPSSAPSPSPSSVTSSLAARVASSNAKALSSPQPQSQIITNEKTASGVNASPSLSTTTLSASDKELDELDMELDAPADFWVSLAALLQKSFAPPIAARILADFRTRHSKFVRALSLDDIERIAEALRSTSTSSSSPPSSSS